MAVFLSDEMMFKTGDKVRVLDDDQKGEVLRIHKNRITILNEFGFEETYNSTELIADVVLEIPDSVVLKKEEPRKKIIKKKESDQPKEIDLHFGQLVDSTRGLEDSDKLPIQLKKISEEMNLAISQKQKKLIFIHGHGSGKLKDEMMKILRKYKNIEIYDASFQKYKGGATMVEFRSF